MRHGKSASGIFRLVPSHGRGFTLVELLVVLTIIATLLSLVAPRYYQHVERSKEVVLRENLASVRNAIDQYRADTGNWPATLEVLVERRYLRAVPADPIAGRNDGWLLVSPPDGESGIHDIRSGAEGVATNGQAYGDW